MKIRFLGAACAPIVLLIVAPLGAAKGQVPHTVERGESLWSIAAEDGITVESLAAANGLDPDAELLRGDTVLIPPASSPGTGVTTGSAGAGAGECVWRCASSAHPHPTDETVSPEQVGAIAAEHGMSSSLVQAIAASESGFDNAAVSSANARGVMQIIPSTWEFIDQQLAAEPLDPTSATDNVEAGVIYLHHLYHQSGGRGRATIASYFQGPNREGLLPETREYVSTNRAAEGDIAGGG